MNYPSAAEYQLSFVVLRKTDEGKTPRLVGGSVFQVNFPVPFG
ncbi:MAG: hypothetical protein R6V07_01955 [Armatimonadota bacterium]